MDRPILPLKKAMALFLVLLLEAGPLFPAEDGGYIGGLDWQERSLALARWLSENEPAQPDFPKEACI